ncbi:PPE family protein [Mycolicibacterium hassiacum DSM 44199]|jgi:PPE-repeat protein|uniref:PPE family protein n=2 Tax=Mycolicibacterium hassiacum TaxID=46351 RepID=K5B9R3_MYCHD|nr:PPE family protein [Mycolicibacterium hassiacum]EKF25898.1 PPE family protein [Mycolicibacterium hassiacum DSM 44199]MDA4088357.1 hypothetical protein [Mycolicibacterium hassiacum DSM 44199]PZN15493.1 MAG: PPE family protein [Mycolicibacterium hassiacum]VCT92453.1 PPE family immunomodulator PPE68 [Mycolicibacterium hassiacum DSM 44199]
MIWHAMPPEVNTGRLMAGPGPAPMLQAAAGWEALAIFLETQADELAASIVSLTSLWSGAASERAVVAAGQLVAWLRTVSAQAHKRAAQATAQANSYSKAMATTPPLPEIEQNHITHAVLEATNFFGINTVPIALNEFDYFVRMWNQAAGAMDVYQAETAVNIMFEPIMPFKPVVIPGVGETATAAALGKAAAQLPASMTRNLVIEQVGAQASIESAALHTGRAVAQANQMAVHAEGQAERTRNSHNFVREGELLQQGSQHSVQQGVQMGVQLGTQLGTQLAQLPQQATQMVSQPMQQLLSPLQQVGSIFGQMGNLAGERAQIGLIGTSPFSNHPLAGGSGPAVGAGLVRAASLPGAGGTPPATPLMNKLLGTEVKVPVGAAAGGPGVGPAPVGAGPMGLGQRGKSGGSKPGLTAPAVLPQDLAEDDEDDW